MTMPSSTSLLLSLSILLPLLGSLVIIGIGRRRSCGGHAPAIFVALLVWVLTIMMLIAIGNGGVHRQSFIALVPPLRLEFRIDPLGGLFAVTIASMFLLALVHAAGYLRDRHSRARQFNALVLANLACMLGVALAGNLITLLVFYEWFSLLAYPLIVHERTPEARRAGLKYLFYILAGGALVFAGVVLAYHAAGNLDFRPGGIFEAAVGHGVLIATFVCLTAGFAVKAALMPLHGWVPDAHPAAPAPFSALLSGVMVAAGVFAIVRVMFELFGPALLVELGVLRWLGSAAGVGVVLAAMLAVAEDDLKRLLAYSTISQMAYVTLAATLLDPTALAGALLHITHHAFFKGGLFFCAGLIIAATGFKRVGQMRGLGRRMPWTAGALTLLALAMIGTPPLSGFIGKWTMGIGMANAGGYARLAVMLAGSLLAALYLWPVIYQLWRRPDNNNPEPLAPSAAQQDRAGIGWMLAAVLAAALLTLILGVLADVPGFPLDWARRAADMLLGASSWG